MTVWDKFAGLHEDDALLASRVTSLWIPQVTAVTNESEAWEEQGRSDTCGANSTDGGRRASQGGTRDVHGSGLRAASETFPGQAAQIVGVYPKQVYIEEGGGAREGSSRGMAGGVNREVGLRGMATDAMRAKALMHRGM